MAASNLFQKECRRPFFATETAKTISKYPCAFVYSERRKYNQVRKRYKHFYGLIFTILQRKIHFWLYLCHLGLYIFRSVIPNAVDFTLSFDTSFVPIEALLDMRTSTFTAKTVFF